MVLDSLKTRTKKYVSRPVNVLRYLTDTVVESGRYLRFSGPPDGVWKWGLSRSNVNAQLTKDYHRLEKGMSLPNPRRPFGSAPMSRVTRVFDKYGAWPELKKNVVEAISAAEVWNELGEIDDEINPLYSPTDFAKLKGDVAAKEVLRTRHSIRNYSSRPVSRHTLEEAFEIASMAPSVCNRQATRVHVYRDEKARELLELQNGNAGFRSTVSTLLVITVDLGEFTGPYEYKQCWIDGGIFAQQLSLSLHAVGVQSCFLNWATSCRTSNALRKQADIGQNEGIICMMAVGYAETATRLARSKRNSVASFSTFHNFNR